MVLGGLGFVAQGGAGQFAACGSLLRCSSNSCTTAWFMDMNGHVIIVNLAG